VDPTITVVSITHSRKQNALADVSIQIETPVGSITINDCRILRNKASDLWFTLPSYAIAAGKGYEYSPVVVLSRELKQAVTSTALTAYEQWAEKSAAPTVALAGGVR
jgi:hypothetical protein